jgi:riboflavin transporter FmnP
VKTVTFIPAILFAGITIAVVAGIHLAKDRAGFAGWVLGIAGFVLIAWAVASLLNVAIFAPIYWLLAKLGRRKAEPPHDDRAS